MLKSIMLLFVLATTGAVSAQTFTNAVAYNDHIVELQNEIGYKMIMFNDAVSAETATAATVKPYYDDLLETTKEVIVKLEKVKPFEKNVELKSSAMELFKFYETTIMVEYKEMIELIFAEEFDDAALIRVQELLVKVTEDEAVVDGKFKKAQEAYAKKYNIDLEENELQEEIDAIGEDE